MALFNLQAGYFAIDNPLRRLERVLHGYKYRQTVFINRRPVELRWSGRAESELRRREHALIVEMQLLFSCVVKKRLLFHDGADFERIPVNDRLELAFRPIASAACDPREFAKNYPAGRDLAAGLAARMVPRIVEIDFRRQRWQGRFHY